MTFESVLAMILMAGVSVFAYLFHNVKADNIKLNEKVLDVTEKERLGAQDEKYTDAKQNADASVDYYNSLKSQITSADTTPAEPSQIPPDTKPSI